MYKKFREISTSCLVLSALLLSLSYSQSISYLSPNSGQEGINDLQVYLYASGVNFYDQYGTYGNPSSAYFSGGGISANNLQIVNSSTVKFDVDISQNTSLTSRDVTLYTNSGSLYKANAFTVTENNDGITSISPSEVQAGGEYQINIYASGVNFTDPYSSSAYQGLSFSGSGIDVSSTQVYSDWIQTTIQVDMLTYTNERDLTVYTDNYTYTLEDALTITDPDPIEIVSISPNSGYQGKDNLLLDITLNNATFMDMYSSTSLIFSGSGISTSFQWNAFSILGDNEVQATIAIASWADVGPHDVTFNVSWQESMSSTLYDGFTVNESDWELISITPNESYRDVQNLQITLQGENTNWGCCGTPQLSFEGYGNDGWYGISVDWVEVNSSEQLTAQIDIYSSANYGYRDVTIISGEQMVNLQDGFHVKPPDATLSPSEGYPGDAFEVTLIGDGVEFSDPYNSANVHFSGSGLNVSNINVTSENSYSFYLSIGDAEPGMRDLYIDQWWGGFDYSFDDVFEVKAHLSKIYVDPQQVIMAKQNEIPIRLSALETDQIESIIFAVEISPTGGNASIEADLDIEISDPNVTAIISQGGDGIASVVISGFDPAISSQDIVIGNLIVNIPQEGVNQGAIYHLSTSSVSGSTPDYEGISMYGIEDVELTVITRPPEIEGLSDVAMIEGTSESVSFTVVDLDGTSLSLSYDAPDYVTCSLDYVSGETEHSGNCSISSYMGAESGMVSLTVTNSEDLPETGNGSFSININHYPVLNITDPIYATVDETTYIDIELSDSDSDSTTLTFLSCPEYVEYFSEIGRLKINPDFGDANGECVFHATDDGIPEIVYDITLQIIVNHPPQFDQFLDDYHVAENNEITVIVLFSDPDDDEIWYSYNAPSFVSYFYWVGDDNGDFIGLEFIFSPTANDTSSTLIITISDLHKNISHTANINVYNTYLAGDVRPMEGPNAGLFGDDLIIAPDVVNALRVATQIGDIPDSTSSLYDAFDVSPIDIDVNEDDDFYDEGERGGDGYIDAADVIVSLKRATMMPGYPNIRRADVNYPNSTHIEDTSRTVTNRDDATDALLFGNIEGHPGETVQVPVTLRRGEGNVSLSGLVSGFLIAGSNDEVPGLESEISFNVEIDGNSMDIPSGNEFLSLLLMDLADLAPNTETLLGTLNFTIPLSADTDDIYYIYTQGSSGTTYDYAPIIFADTFIGVVPVTTQIPVNQTIQSGIGWNWFSINVESDDMSVNNVLSSLSAISGDFIKSQGASAEYYAEFGWFGSLENINIIDMYQLDIENGGTISFTGYPADPSSATIHLTDGWNWIGYVPQNAGIINDALGSIGDSGVFIKNQAASAEYYDEFGWFGSLDYMAPGDGYQLQIIGESDLIYPNFEADDGLTRTKEVKVLPASISEWVVNPHAYEFNGAITLSVDNREDSPGDYIAAFVGGECRGVAERMDFPFDEVDRGIYILMAYSNMELEEEITFKYYNGEEEVIDYTESLEFTIDMVVGNGFKPFGLSREFIIPTEFSLSAAYPNPFNPTTTLSLALPIESEVFISIYNLQGREVASLVNGNLEAGYHSVVWNADEFGSGIYFVQMIAGDYNHTQKLMLVK